MCESPGGRPGLPVPTNPYGLCGRKATLNETDHRAQELCESRGGRPGLPVPNSLYGLCGRRAVLKKKSRTLYPQYVIYLYIPDRSLTPTPRWYTGILHLPTINVIDKCISYVPDRSLTPITPPLPTASRPLPNACGRWGIDYNTM